MNKKKVQIIKDLVQMCLGDFTEENYERLVSAIALVNPTYDELWAAIEGDIADSVYEDVQFNLEQDGKRKV